MKKPVVTIARYQDRIPTDKTPEEAAAIHGAGSVFVDGKPYSELLAEARKEEEPAVPQDVPVKDDPPADGEPGGDKGGAQ